MKPKKLRVPAVVHHKASGQDVVFLRDEHGKRRMVYLGEHGSTTAARRYREVLAEHLAGKPVATRARPARRSIHGSRQCLTSCPVNLLCSQETCDRPCEKRYGGRRLAAAVGCGHTPAWPWRRLWRFVSLLCTVTAGPK